MLAAYIDQPGPPDALRVGAVPDPVLAPGQVLVRVRASSVNPIDTYIRSGMIKSPIPLPYIVGCDVAGVVEAVAAEVRHFKPGDRVWGTNQGLLGRQGATAELAAIDEQWLYPIPDGIAENDMAAIALVGITAHLALFRSGQLKRDETVFVNGGSGGVGSCVVQMAKAAGARVLTTAGSPENAVICRQYGAHETILYREENVGERIKALAPDGIDVWVESLREPDLETSIPLLAPRGRMILMAGRDAKPKLPLGSFYTRDCKLLGMAVFNASAAEMHHAAESIYGWMSEKKLKARIGKVFPMSEIAAAHTLQEANTIGNSGTLAGKIVITIP